VTDGLGVFRGTASWYAKFRRGYPPAVIKVLQQQARLTPSSQVLDLGCGTGQIALDVAPLVGSVTGVDVDDGMLTEAAAGAERRGLGNCRWLRSSAEAFPYESGIYDLAVIGSAFHWMDRPVVAAKVYESLVPQGVFAVLGNPAPLDQVQRREGTGKVIAEVQDRWFDAHARPQGSSPDIRHEDVIAGSPFGKAEVSYHPTSEEWEVDSLLGFLRSTSLRPDQVLGEKFEAFAEDLRTAILVVQPGGRWTVENRFEVILAHKR